MSSGEAIVALSTQSAIAAIPFVLVTCDCAAIRVPGRLGWVGTPVIPEAMIGRCPSSAASHVHLISPAWCSLMGLREIVRRSVISVKIFEGA
jgi:hypothetical protein